MTAQDIHDEALLCLMRLQAAAAARDGIEAHVQFLAHSACRSAFLVASGNAWKAYLEIQPRVTP